MSLLTPTVELHINGVWTDITSYVLVEQGLVITQGRPDEQGGQVPSTCTMTLNNKDGRFTPRNPTGPYYGFIGRNTPCRVSCGSTDRWHGEISAWPQTWSMDENMGWVTVQGAGITRRLTQGPKPLPGPIRRWVSMASNVSGYWPLEDAATSLTAASAIGGAAMFSPLGSRPKYAADRTFPTSDPLPVLSRGSIQGLTGHTSGRLNAHMLLYYPEEDTNDGIILRFIDTGAYRWEVRYFTANDGSLILRAFNSAGSSLLTSTAITGVNSVPGILTLETLPSGGSTGYAMRFTDFEAGTTTSVTGSVADAGAQLGYVQLNADLAASGAVVGHLIVTTTAQTTDIVDAMRGHTGETAGRRIERLCTEEGVPFDSVGDLDETEPMGMQTSGTFIELVRQCEATDAGYLYEPADSLALAYRTRESMYSQDPAASIAYSDSFVAFTPIDDDQGTRNDVTVSRIGGAQARHEVTSGPLSTQAPPDGVGRYDVRLNLSLDQDSQAEPIAQWHAARGTIDEPRYPDTAINVWVKDTVQADVAAIVPGDLVEITDPPLWTPQSDVRALVVGWTETILPTRWLFSLNLVPAAVFDVVVLDDDQFGRLDSASTVLDEDLDETETGVDYTGDTWITTASHPSEFPFDIIVGGEVMTVTAATSTTFTVTRSVNGVVKSHSSGDAVRLHRPNRLAL